MEVGEAAQLSLLSLQEAFGLISGTAESCAVLSAVLRKLLPEDPKFKVIIPYIGNWDQGYKRDYLTRNQNSPCPQQQKAELL